MPAANVPPAAPRRDASVCFRRRWAIRGLASCLAGILSLAAGEIVVRLYLAGRGCTPNCFASPILLFQAHPENGFELNPGFRMRSVVLDLKINSQGLRGPEIRFEKPAGRQRVALLGESSAFGYFMSEGEYASAILERRLRSAGRDVEVLNAAVPSYHLEQIVRRYRERVKPLKPDVVILYLGWNDLRRITSVEEPAATRPQLGSPLERWLAEHSALWGLLRYRLFPQRPPFVPPEEGNLLPTAEGSARFKARLEELAAEIESTPATMIVCCQAMAAHPHAPADIRRELSSDPERQEQTIAFGRYLHETLRDFAARHDATFVDAYDEMPPTYDYLGDGIHLTPRGEQKLAELWHEPVATALDAGTAARP